MGDDPNAAADAAKANAASEAARQDWFTERVIVSLQVKSEKFKKMMLQEEAARPMLDFFTLAECQRVFVCEGAKELACFDTVPGNQKKKMIYFIKPRQVVLTADNCSTEVICGDLSPGILPQLHGATADIYLPLLTNPHNVQGLPEVVISDLMESFHRLVGSIYVTIGHTKGETLLPLPPLEVAAADRAAKDKDRVHALETSVVTWTKQIKNVLKLDPEHALKSGDHPGPMAELEFWASKARHLNSVKEQVRVCVSGRWEREGVDSWRARRGRGGGRGHARRGRGPIGAAACSCTCTWPRAASLRRLSQRRRA